VISTYRGTLRLGLNQIFFEFPYEFCIKIKLPTGANYFNADSAKAIVPMREFPVHRKTQFPPSFVSLRKYKFV
jgi:hypothetical protein